MEDESMKVIFLDVDGVLNTDSTVHRFGSDFIDPVLVKLVAKIVWKTGAIIILSSSWRLDAKDTQLVREALAMEGLSIHSCTPFHAAPSKWIPRNEEIMEWMYTRGHDVTEFAIIDDDNSAEIGGNFFQTNDQEGLTEELASKIIEHLTS
jgi:hypothetical protein